MLPPDFCCFFVCLFRFFVICFSSTVRGVSCFTQPSFIFLFFISKQFPLLINRLLKVKATFLTKQTHTPCMELNRRISFTITPIYQLYTASSVTDFNFVSKHGAETMRLIRDGEKGGGRGYGGGGRGRLYTCRYTVTTRMTPALRWAAMRAILMFHNCEGQSHKTVSTDHNFSRERRRSRFEPKSLCLPAQRLTARPDRLTQFCSQLTSITMKSLIHFTPVGTQRFQVLPCSSVKLTLYNRQDHTHFLAQGYSETCTD